MVKLLAIKLLLNKFKQALNKNGKQLNNKQLT
jgi:hypothetical protein